MKNGFTLIEIMVAVSIFAIVALITTGALVTASEVNRKAQAIKIAMDNVSFAMDSMVANLRDGANYTCLTGTLSNDPNAYYGYFQTAKLVLGSPLHGCTSGGRGLIFTSRRGTSVGAGNDKYIIYHWKTKTNGLSSIQTVSSDSCQPSDCPFIDLTSSEVDISSLLFYVPQSSPITRATIVILGQVPGKTPTKFNLQTTVKANF